MLFVTRRIYQRDRARARVPMAIAMGLGAAFVALQGAEWVALLRQGLTLTSSSLGSFFYLIIGLHGLHVVVAIGILVYTWRAAAARLARVEPARDRRGVLVLRGRHLAGALPGGLP